MKYTTEVTVGVPLKEFAQKMDNPNNMKHWQKGLQSFEHISGAPGKIGAKMKLNYKFGKREMSLIETVIENKFPDAFHATYDAKGMHNIQKNYFKETPQGHTKWISENEFVPTNFMMRFMTVFMKGAFKKQSLSYMEDFKSFAENGTSVATQ